MIERIAVKAALVAVMLLLSGSPPHAAEPGGIGPVRLGMGQAEAEEALLTIARDPHVIPLTSLHEFATGPMRPYEVFLPWERVVTATMASGARIQVGFGNGHVVTISVREKLQADGGRCASLYNERVRDLEQRFGPMKVEHGPSYNAESDFGRRVLDGWKLYEQRQGFKPDTCSLMTDFISDEDAQIEASWRARG